ncbi:hypothetical protein D4764_0047490 [Takifugu flavidus]|uniref:Uncharacterized protein n=1 Tax=Takifugu flavidus TaxID=433684 RepID=A0A5C6MFS3_9TELE|nr:hypothetical protein D4764_0047490 [Takifugu flavidus]
MSFLYTRCGHRGPDPSQTFCPTGCTSRLESNPRGLDLTSSDGQVQSMKAGIQPGFTSYQGETAFTKVNGTPGWLGAQEELRLEPLLLPVERSQLRWLRHLFQRPSGHLPREVL